MEDPKKRISESKCGFDPLKFSFYSLIVLIFFPLFWWAVQSMFPKDSPVRPTIAIETSYTLENQWLNWLVYTTRDLNRPDSLVCATARPLLATVPFTLTPIDNPEDFQCMLSLFKGQTGHGCTSLNLLYPAMPSIMPPAFAYYSGHYACLRSVGGATQVGTLTNCSTTLNVTAGEGNVTADQVFGQSTARADVWWYCGDGLLRDRLPESWTGVCAMVRLIMPMVMLPLDKRTRDTLTVRNPRNQALHRRRRETPAAALDENVHVDVVGVPRAVPDEYQALNQMSRVFELAFPWPSDKENVDWIKYVYYNQQRFVSLTTDAFDELDTFSLITWENTMTSAMLFAERGGVWQMFGSAGCTFIPKNSAPDGAVVRALAGPTSLPGLAVTGGHDDSSSGLLDSWFRQNATFFITALTTIFLTGAVLIVFVICFEPFVVVMTLNKEPLVNWFRNALSEMTHSTNLITKWHGWDTLAGLSVQSFQRGWRLNPRPSRCVLQQDT